MADIKQKLVIKTNADNIYKAITNQEGITQWWCKNTTAKPETGFVNVFVFGENRIEMKVTVLVPGERVEWECIQATEEWMNTGVSFELEEKDGKTILRFGHTGWQAATDFFAACTYDWAQFLRSLKSFCETGAGMPV